MRILLAALTLCLNGLVVQASNENDKQAFKEAYTSYQAAITKGNWSNALEHAKQAYALGKSVYGPAHKNTAALALNYGRLLKGDEAERALEKAVILYEKVYGSDAFELIDPLVDLAATKARYARFLKALKYYRRALKLAEKHDPENLTLIGVINLEMGSVALSKSQSSRAIKYLSKAEEVLSTQSNDRAKMALAKAKFWKGKYRLATKKFQKAKEELNASLKTFEEFSPNGSFTLTNHAFLIEAYEELGMRDEATKHCQAIGAAKPFDPNQDYKPVYLVQPKYPVDANRRGAEGSVVVSFTVDDSGFVTEPQVIDIIGDRGFNTAALEAVKKARFAPRHINGQPVETNDVRYKFTFSLAN